MSEPPRGPIQLVAVWLAVVALSAAVTSVVVTRVGQTVAAELEQPLPRVLAGGTAPAGPTGTLRPSDAGGVSAPPQTSPSASGAARSERDSTETTPVGGTRPSTGTGSEAASEAGSEAGSATETGTNPGGDDGPVPPPTAGTPASPVASYSASGGFVTVWCRDRQAQLKSVTPNNGYTFDTEAEGASVHAVFSNGSRTDEIEVSCSSGLPVRSGPATSRED